MKKLLLTLTAILMFALTACTSTTNPLSSEYDENQDGKSGHIPLYSGHRENG